MFMECSFLAQRWGGVQRVGGWFRVSHGEKRHKALILNGKSVNSRKSQILDSPGPGRTSGGRTHGAVDEDAGPTIGRVRKFAEPGEADDQTHAGN